MSSREPVKIHQHHSVPAISVLESSKYENTVFNKKDKNGKSENALNWKPPGYISSYWHGVGYYCHAYSGYTFDTLLPLAPKCTILMQFSFSVLLLLN